MIIIDFSNLKHPDLKSHKLWDIEPADQVPVVEMKNPPVKVINATEKGIEKTLEEYVRKKEDVRLKFEGDVNFFQYRFLEDFALRTICERDLDDELLIIRSNPNKNLYYKNAVFYLPVHLQET